MAPRPASAAKPGAAALAVAAVAALAGCGRPVSRPPAEPALAGLLSRPGAAGVRAALVADVEHLSSRVGPRPTGSAPFEEALGWARARLGEALGREVVVQRFSVPGTGSSANLVGTLPGRERPGEIVLLAAHLDSFPASPGALDDAAGVALVLDAARALSAAPPCARSVRFVLFGAEEQGMWGSSVYVRREAASMASHAAVLVLDAGAGPLRAFSCGGNRPFGLAAIAPLRLPGGPGAGGVGGPGSLGGLHVLDGPYGGSDSLDFLRAGVPVLAPLPPGKRYEALRHGAGDVLSPQDPDALAESAGIVSALAWVLANAHVPAASWRLDAGRHRRLLAALAEDLARVRERDALLDRAEGELPAPGLSPACAAPPAPRGERP